MSYDLAISGGDLVINNGKLQTVIDSDKLRQDVLKICLTPVGGNIFHPSYGSFLSRSIVGNSLSSDVLVTIAKSQLNTCLTNIQQLQKIQVQSFQKVSPDEQLAAVLGLDVSRSTIDPRVFGVKISIMTKGFKPISTGFDITNIQ